MLYLNFFQIVVYSFAFVRQLLPWVVSASVGNEYLVNCIHVPKVEECDFYYSWTIFTTHPAN